LWSLLIALLFCLCWKIKRVNYWKMLAIGFAGLFLGGSLVLLLPIYAGAIHPDQSYTIPREKGDNPFAQGAAYFTYGLIWKGQQLAKANPFLSVVCNFLLYFDFLVLAGLVVVLCYLLFNEIYFMLQEVRRTCKK